MDLLPIITIDFETYFDKDYTLTKLSTSEYIRNINFLAHGLGIQTPDDTFPRWIPKAYIKQELARYNWDNYALLCHNTAFDGLILSHHYDIHPKFLLDTLSMARGWFGTAVSASLDSVAKQFKLGNKVPNVLMQTKGLRELPGDLEFDLGMYCIQDVNLTKQIFDIFIRLYYPSDELKIIHHTLKAFTEPKLLVNKDLIYLEIERLNTERTQLLEQARDILGDPNIEITLSKLSSNPKFAQVLKQLGVQPPTKISPTTGKTTFAFAKQDLTFQALHQINPDVSTVCNARLNAKSNIGHTRALRFLANADPALPVLMNYCGAHTMRFSAANKLNLQNLPRINPKDPTSGQLRKSICAPEGYKLVIADSSQIEDRMNCYVSGQLDILETYRNKEDAYKAQASKIYGTPIHEVTSEQRFLGKVARLALGYGCGVNKFHNIVLAGLMGPPVNISRNYAKDIVYAYRRTNMHIIKFWETCYDFMINMANGTLSEYKIPGMSKPLLTIAQDQILMPNNLKLHYKHINPNEGYYISRENKQTKIYGGLLAENIIQCLARIAVISQILTIAESETYASLALLVHDEGVFLVQESRAEELLEKLLLQMRTPLPWCPDLPFDADGIISDFYDKP